jgi:hypothetical protein
MWKLVVKLDKLLWIEKASRVWSIEVTSDWEPITFRKSDDRKSGFDARGPKPLSVKLQAIVHRLEHSSGTRFVSLEIKRRAGRGRALPKVIVARWQYLFQAGRSIFVDIGDLLLAGNLSIRRPPLATVKRIRNCYPDDIIESLQTGHPVSAPGGNPDLRVSQAIWRLMMVKIPVYAISDIARPVSV